MARTALCHHTGVIDWQGATVCIISGGQSAPGVLPYLTPDMKILLVNRAFELTSGDALYAADASFWRHYPKAHEFPGRKFCAEPVEGVERLEIATRQGRRVSEMIRGPVGTVGYGCNGGFQALNLAVQFGAVRVLLAGYDFGGTHWHDDHKHRNPKDKELKQWAKILDDQAKTLSDWGVEVVNFSKCSRLRNFVCYADSTFSIRRTVGIERPSAAVAR